MPAISIIVPVFNAEPFISNCIESVLTQDFRDYELILVDDGSTDCSLDICEQYAQKDNRIKVKSKKNGGVSSARNVGLVIATGEYITFLDSDDWLDGNFLYEAYTECHKYNLDIYLSGNRQITMDGAVFSISSIDRDYYVSNRKINTKEKHTLLEKAYNAGPCAKLYRKQLISGKFFDESLVFGEDLKFVFSALRDARFVYATSKVMYNYRMNPNGITKIISLKKCESMRRTYSFLFSDLKAENLKNDDFECYLKYLKLRWEQDYKRSSSIILSSGESVIRKYFMLHSLLKDKELRTVLEEEDDTARFYSYFPIVLVTRNMLGKD